MRASVDGIVRAYVLGDDEELELLERFAHRAGTRERHGRICRHHPQRLDLAARDGLEHVDGLEAFMRRNVWSAPETAHAVSLRRRETHMRGELISQSANLAPAHGVGLAGKRERPHARPADASRGEVAIDDGVDLVSALRRLIDALRITGDDAGAGVEQIEEVADVLLAQA